ncbi:MAG: double-strand break repair protein AddB [Emcibacter sp.]|nr:double-strand break repair protein AddB [Emcibacter sp.]
MPERLNKAPELYTLASHTSFVDGLVRGIRKRFGDDPLTLSDVLILLPNRRAVRSLRDAFLRASGGKSLILPRIEPIGDVDEDDLFLSGNLMQTTWETDLAPPIPPFMRQMLLMDIINRWSHKSEGSMPEIAQCAILARALGQFLDHVQTERLTFQDLENLVPSEYANHWQKTLDFLKILTEHWPDILAPTGFSDAAMRRNILLDSLREQWMENPPDHPIIAAGSTGSIPATADLLGVISRLPQGMVVLPGLDLSMDEISWEAIDDTHPQATMKHLLSAIGAGRDVVKDWLNEDISEHRRTRNYLLREVMRPAQTTDQWRFLDLDLAAATKGFRRIDAPGPREEAGIIALMLREALETDGKTAALVTPDRQLARRVAGEMKRWDILIDDSAGTPLFNTTVGVFLRLTAQMIGEGAAPVQLLSVLKHPLCAGGQEVGHFRKMTRLLEEYILRGPRPGAGCAGISRAIEMALTKRKNSKSRFENSAGNISAITDLQNLKDWWQATSELIMPFEQIMAQEDTSFEALLIGHIDMTESLSASYDRSGAERLWKGDAGEEAAKFIEDLHQAAFYLPRLKSENYPALLDVFMGGITVRPKYGQHPRLNIWGPLEARLQHADLVILAGLNEGVWPPEPAADPWMSRPMRKDFGLPSLEQKIGLSAHDFLQAASAPQVVLTRSEKMDGTPTVKSRWLSRLDAVAPDISLQNISGQDPPSWLAWYKMLDLPLEKKDILPPRPTPPATSRPRKLSVTGIQKWMQDPYSIYARYILKFTVLDPLDADPGAADKGTIIHDALDDFMGKYSDQLPGDAKAELIDIGRKKFESYLDRPTVRAFWWPRFVHVAEWFVEQEKTRRPYSKTAATEIEGRMAFDVPGGEFILTAKADRIDLLENGSYSIIDYKTGQSPTVRKIYAGYAPQLPLEGLMAEAGNFAGLKAATVSDLSYWQLKGGEDVAKISSFNLAARNKMDVTEVIKASFDGLLRLVTRFDLEETPYLNNPRPDNLGYGEYDHLARTREWQGNDLSRVKTEDANDDKGGKQS